MELWKGLLKGYLGGMGYVALELLWRHWSHGSMFLLGGACFLLLGKIRRRRLPLGLKVVLGAWCITGLELLSGLLLNRYLGLQIWDYTGMWGNVLGQVCPVYLLLWHPVAALGLLADWGLEEILKHRAKAPCHCQISAHTGVAISVSNL